MPTRAVLFDFDGVLADTENVHIAAWERTFGLMGWNVLPEECSRAAEIDDRDFLRGVFAGRGIDDGDIDGWVRRKQDLTVAMLADCPRLYPGIIELVEHLSGRLPLGVVSGTWRENVTAVLGPAGLLPHFAVVVGKEDVLAVKPDPEAYRIAVRRLDMPPTDVVALEDSPTGLASALAAGVRCVAVGHRRVAGDWAAGAAFLPDLGDLSAVLDQLRLS